MVTRTTVRLPDELFAQARRKAVAEGRSLSALVEEGLRRVVGEPSGVEDGNRTLPPVSSATGGLRPGIDLDDMSAVEEFGDLRIAAQMRLDALSLRLAAQGEIRLSMSPEDAVRAERDGR